MTLKMYNWTKTTIVQLIKFETLSFTIVWSKTLYDITAFNEIYFPVIDLTIYSENKNEYQIMANTYPALFAINPANGNTIWEISHAYNDQIQCQPNWYYNTLRIFYKDDKIFRPSVITKYDEYVYPYISCPGWLYSTNEFRLAIYSTKTGDVLLNETLLENVINTTSINFVAMTMADYKNPPYYLYGVNPSTNRLSCWNISLQSGTNTSYQINYLWSNKDIYSNSYQPLIVNTNLNRVYSIASYGSEMTDPVYIYSVNALDGSSIDRYKIFKSDIGPTYWSDVVIQFFYNPDELPTPWQFMLSRDGEYLYYLFNGNMYQMTIDGDDIQYKNYGSVYTQDLMIDTNDNMANRFAVIDENLNSLWSLSDSSFYGSWGDVAYADNKVYRIYADYDIGLDSDLIAVYGYEEDK